MSQYDPTVALEVNVGPCDLYFMVQWFYVTSWRHNLMYDYHSLGLCDLYFIAFWFCLISPTIWCLSVIFTYNLFVCLSLLTMTNPNQMCEVLLFVCSKMADKTNLSSKLPVADSTREVWGRKLCWWCLSSGFSLCTFLLGFADSFCFVFTSTPSYEALALWSSAICSHNSVGMLKSLREALRVSLYHFFWPPWECFLTCSSP